MKEHAERKTPRRKRLLRAGGYPWVPETNTMDTRTKAREDTGLQRVWEAAGHGLGEEELGAGKGQRRAQVGAHGRTRRRWDPRPFWSEKKMTIRLRINLCTISLFLCKLEILIGTEGRPRQFHATESSD